MNSADEVRASDTDSGTQEPQEECLRDRYRRLGPVLTEAELDGLEALAD
jgi:hypothetical protein